ncbi:MAG: O-antigen ligase family protein [Candidatus Omnitrophica bacterium]|nr:O-antigen ligase family protein [Candidatus Omnitrophota bacterium]
MLSRLIFIGSCIFALTLPFDFSLKNINLDIPLIKSLLGLEIVILLFLWELVIIFERRLKIKTKGLLLPLFIFFTIHLFSAIFPSDRMVWSLKYTFRFFGLSSIYFILINFITDKRRLSNIIDCLFISVALAAILVIIQYFFPYALIPWQRFFDDALVSVHRIRGLFGWPTEMSVYLGTFIPLILSHLIYRINRDRLFYLPLFLIIILALILSKTRGWILGVFCGLVTLWLLDLIQSKSYKIIGMTAVILVISIIIFWNRGLFKFIASDLEPSEKGRLIFAKDALKAIQAHPFKGMGADMFYWNSAYHCRTHNIFLETAVNLGIFGLLVLLWLFYDIFKLIGRGLSKPTADGNRYLQWGIFASLVSFLACNQVDYFWHKHEIIGLFWFIVGIGVLAASLTKKVQVY